MTLRAAARAQAALAAALGALPGEQFEWATQIALARHPELAPAPDGNGELALVLPELGTVTQRHLQAFAAACAQPGGPGAVWPALPVGAGVPPVRRPAPSPPAGFRRAWWTLGLTRAGVCQVECRRRLEHPPQSSLAGMQALRCSRAPAGLCRPYG